MANPDKKSIWGVGISPYSVAGGKDIRFSAIGEETNESPLTTREGLPQRGILFAQEAKSEPAQPVQSKPVGGGKR